MPRACGGVYLVRPSSIGPPLTGGCLMIGSSVSRALSPGTPVLSKSHRPFAFLFRFDKCPVHSADSTYASVEWRKPDCRGWRRSPSLDWICTSTPWTTCRRISMPAPGRVGDSRLLSPQRLEAGIRHEVVPEEGRRARFDVRSPRFGRKRTSGFAPARMGSQGFFPGGAR